MLNLINIIQSEKRYRDRFRFLLSLDQKIEKQVIYTQGYLSDISDLQHTVVKIPPKKYGSGVKFWMWVLFDISKFLRHTKKKWIIIEHGTGFVLFFLRALRFSFAKRIVLIYACYNENRHYLDEKVWRKDDPELLSKKQDEYYLKSWRKRVSREKIYFRAADGIFSNSPRIVDWAAKQYQKPTFRLFNTINDCPTEKIGLNKGIDVLYAGDLTPAKGIISLLKALNSITEELKVVFIGKVNNQDALWWEKVRNKYDFHNISIYEHMSRDELNDFYIRSKSFVLPSYSEGSPRVVLEALCYGCKVIVSDIPGSSFPGENNPINYYLTGNYEKLKKEILTAVETSKDDMGNNLLFIDQFSEDKVGSDLLSFYKTFFKD